MKKILLFTILLSALSGQVKAQNNLIRLENLRRIDSVEKSLKTNFCHSDIIYKDNFNKKYLKNDLAIFEFLNKVFKDDIRINQLEVLQKKIKNTRVGKLEKKNGLINNLKLILNGNYLRADISLDFIDSIILNRSCLISFTTNGICNKENFKVLDFRYLKDIVTPNIGFTINIRDIDVVSEKVEIQNIESMAKKYSDYNFNVPSIGNPDWLNQFLLNQYIGETKNYYSLENANKNFVKLVKENRTDVVKSLLYSPNYFYSINAMESLMYLNSINKITIDDRMKIQINKIKESDYLLTIQKSGDSFGTVKGYKALGTSEEGVIKKLQKSFK
jgi:hypothetical protein